MRLIILLTQIVLLLGCQTTIVEKPKFPTPPAELMKDPETLKTLAK